MKHWIFIALFFVSCSPGADRKEAPENLIGKKKMVKVMTELMKLEGHANAQFIQVTRYEEIITASADSLFKAQGVSSKQFEASFEYYAHQQSDLEEIYEAVLDNLNHEMTELELEEEERKKGE
ncbi:MAG: DUF4296 domain-containing protein [bacterium]|nr:DUF4296 domain-containing protein [bacterium]